MQKSATNSIKLGIFVSIAILLLIAAIYFIGQRQQLFGKTFQISAIFKEVSGLQVGNTIRFAGINVGIVENIEQITDTSVRVDMLIDIKSQKFIKKNAKAIVGSDGLMGNKIVLITPGAANKSQIQNNDIIATATPVSLDEILANLKITTDNAATITGDLATIINNIKSGKGTIGKLFMDSVFAENVDEAMLNIKQGAGGFKQNMKAASKSVLLRGFFKKKK